MRKIISYIISFFLIISITLVVFMIFLSSTILNINYIISALERNGYYNEVYTNIRNRFNEYILQSGLDESVLNDLYSKEQIQKDIKNVIKNVYQNNEIEIDVTELKENLKKNITESISPRVLNDTEQKSVDEFIDEIGNVYITEVSHYTYINKATSVIYTIISVIKKSEVIIYSIFIVLIMTLMIINKRHLLYAIIMFFTSILGSGMIIVISEIIFRWKIKIDNLFILNQSVSNIIKYIFENTIGKIKILGILLVVVSIIFILLFSAFRIKKHKRL